MAVPLSLAAVLWSASGCSESTRTAGGDAGLQQQLVGRSCNVDDECGGLRCDAIRRQCVCLGDEHCANATHSGIPTPYCNNFTGLCVENVAGCKADSECPAGAWCDGQVRACKVRKGFCEPCDSDRECGGDADDCVEDATLKAKFCGKTCSADADCAVGATCQDFNGKKQCWPASGKNCKVFTGCTPDSRKTCDTSADCAEVPDQVCDTGTGLCVARVQNCPFGQVCDPRSRICVDACHADSDCMAIDPKLRCVHNACEPIGQCAATPEDPSGDKSCPPDKVCSFSPGLTAGVCVPFCSSHSDCPPANICRRTDDGRSKCQPGCLANADCPPDQKCVKVAGAVIGTCEGTPNQTCQTDIACPVCASCDIASNICKSAAPLGLCKPCGTNADCGLGHCLELTSTITGVSESRCGQPCPPAGCPRGFVCNEICVNGTYQGNQCLGTRVAECIPVDQSCTTTNSTGQRVEKCL